MVEQIKNLKIQGAQNIAKAALQAYMHANDRALAFKKLVIARPTEPMLKNVLKLAEVGNPEQVLGKLASDEDKLVKLAVEKLKGTRSVYTHCHSSTVLKIIKSVRPSVVYNTETRPLYQGRVTTEEIASFGVKVVHSVDSLMASQIEKSDVVLLGADAITAHGFYNKVGSLAACMLAKILKKPVCVCAHSLKFSKEKIDIEQRDKKEVWDKSINNIEVVNPAFEFVPKEYVGKIASELGVLAFNEFLKRIKT